MCDTNSTEVNARRNLSALTRTNVAIDPRSAAHYGLLALVTAILLFPLLLLPLNPDNDTYQAMAFALSEGKGLPYLGSWDQNFPGVVFYHWLSIKLFGLTELGFRIVDLLNRVAIALVVFAMVYRRADIRSSWLSVVLVVSFYLLGGYWNAGQRDSFASFWLILMLLAITREHVRRTDIIFAGAAIAIAAFIRPTNAIFIALLLGPWLTRQQTFVDALYGIGSFAVFMLILVLPWISEPGGMEAFITATVRFNTDVYGGVREPAGHFFETLQHFLPLCVLGLLGLIIALRYDAVWRKGWALFVTYTILGFGVILLMGKYHVYHFEILFPVLIIGACWLISKLAGILKYPKLVYVAVAAVVIYLYYPHGLIRDFIARGGDNIAREKIYNNLSSFPVYGREIELEISQYLESIERDRRKVEILTLWPGLRWRSGYPGLSRFTTTYALSMEGPYGLTNYQIDWRNELDSLLTLSRPTVIVAAMGPEYLFRYSKISSDSLLRSLPRMRELVLNEYYLDTTFGGYRVYRRT